MIGCGRNRAGTDEDFSYDVGMEVIALQSGSNGNCYYVESKDTSIVIDAGISAKIAKERLATHDRNISDAHAVFITHDHSDHCRSLGAFNRKLGLPVYMTKRTAQAMKRYRQIGNLDPVHLFQAGQTVEVGSLSIHSIPTPHDAVDGVAYVVEDNKGHRVGILTDLGHVFKGLKDVLSSLDGVVIESNYDEQMLDAGYYPESLKRRIRGKGGHLSNVESARLLHQSSSTRLQWACLCHLSEDNNNVETAIRIHQQWLGDDLPIFVAGRYQSTRLGSL